MSGKPRARRSPPPAEGWRRPEFCRECGAAFPWVDRQGRIYQLENMLAGEGLDEATEFAVREQLEVPVFASK